MAVGVGADGVAAYVGHLRGIHRWWHGDLPGARDDHARAAAWFEARTDPTAIEIRKFEALVLVQDGQAEEGLTVLRRAASTYRTMAATWRCAHTLAYLGHCHRFLGDDDAALANWQEAAKLLEGIDNSATAVHVQLGLGEVAVERRDWYAASRHAGAALAQMARSGNSEYAAWGWTVAVRAALGAGDVERAFACARSGLAVVDQVVPGEASRLAGELAVLAASVGDWRRAARLIGSADAGGGPREFPFTAPSETRRWERTRAEVVAALGDGADALLRAGGGCTLVEAAGSLVMEISGRTTDGAGAGGITTATPGPVVLRRRRTTDHP